MCESRPSAVGELLMAHEPSPAFQFYPKDFITDGNVAAMSLEERGAYITLLCLCWQECSLPTDPKRLAIMVGVPHKAFLRFWPAIVPCFVEQGGRLVQPRLEKERAKQVDFRRRQSEAGKASAAGRQPNGNRGSTTVQPDQQPNQQPDDNQGATERQPEGNSPSPISGLHFPVSDLQSPVSEGDARARRGSPLVAKRRKDAAFEGPRVYVPQRAHSDFVALRHGAEAELYAWYEAVSNEWTDGPRRTEEPGPDMFAFWKARYAEQWPTTKVDPRVPVWAR